VEVRLSVENQPNTRYDLDDGFGGLIGPQAPGRNIRFSIAVDWPGPGHEDALRQRRFSIGARS
jgi:hypothetical protein